MQQLKDKQKYKGRYDYGIRAWLRRIPLLIGDALAGKSSAFSSSARLRDEKVPLGWSEGLAEQVRAEIKEMLRRDLPARRSQDLAIPDGDLVLAEEIAAATREAGRSNLSRTAAYLECYEACPELHWAFLAHMVSRNAGWAMTDLRGRMEQLVAEKDQQLLYRFIERSNALIFQDAYPQLLLYKKSRETGSSHFHLLSRFHVSKFMIPFWERFWVDRNSALLTVGLIINEQNYIEQRVMQHPYYRKHITGRAAYHMQSLAGLNQVVFPLLEDDEGCLSSDGATRLAGRVVSDFGSLEARIALGKSLYAMLMGLRAVSEGAHRFAARVPHSGSRSDYWPGWFTANRAEALTAPRQGPELLQARTLPAGQRLYSPKLLDAWGDTPYEPISREDWLKGPEALDSISAPQAPFLCDISGAHRGAILKIAFAHDVTAEDDS